MRKSVPVSLCVCVCVCAHSGEVVWDLGIALNGVSAAAAAASAAAAAEGGQADLVDTT